MDKESIYAKSILCADRKGYQTDGEGGILSKDGKPLKLFIYNKGHHIEYRAFKIRDDEGKSRLVKVHQFVAYKKFGERLFDDGIEVRHLNGDPLDNSYGNIEIGTHSQNMMDCDEKVRIRKAHYAASFTKKYEYEEIVGYYNDCHSYKKTMERFGISSKGTLVHILKHKGY